MLYEYPSKAKFGKNIPKTKFYEKANINAKVKEKFVSQVSKIIWQYKLSSETINLSRTENIAEIQVFDIELKSEELDIEVLKAIDKSIPFPIVFQLKYNHQIQIKTAYKRVNESDKTKWIIDSYFSSKWYDFTYEKSPLPVVLNIEKLYEKIIENLMTIKISKNIPLQEKIENINRLEVLEKQYKQLKSKRDKEKQFNKKVECNSLLKDIKKEIELIK